MNRVVSTAASVLDNLIRASLITADHVGFHKVFDVSQVGVPRAVIPVRRAVHHTRRSLLERIVVLWADAELAL